MAALRLDPGVVWGMGAWFSLAAVGESTLMEPAGAWGRDPDEMSLLHHVLV